MQDKFMDIFMCECSLKIKFPPEFNKPLNSMQKYEKGMHEF